MAEDTNKTLDQTIDKAKDAKKSIEDLNSSYNKMTEDMKRTSSIFGIAALSLADGASAYNAAQKSYDEARKSGDAAGMRKAGEDIEAATRQRRAILEVGEAFRTASVGAMDYARQFDAAFSNVDTKTAGPIGFAISAIRSYDEATEITRKFKNAAMDVGNTFGQSFGQIQPQFTQYANSVLLAEKYTYETRDAIEAQTKSLASMGVSLQEMSQVSNIAGQSQNLLSMGFLLASDSGLSSQKTFEMMATAMRRMGLSAEERGKPILSLQAIARSTGLPMDDLSNKIFGLTNRYSRFGMTIDNLAPVVKRFTDVLGEGFKGLAVEEVQNLVEGLGRQVNTTQGAFMAMQSGMARPGSGVAGAMLDFEDAMAKPEEAMKMLSASLSNIGGGRIIKFEEAKAEGEAGATMFKLQRDMLSQLTGINDPQQTRTLLSILSDLQSGRQVSVEQKETFDRSFKSGQQKQDERATASARFMRVMSGLMVEATTALARLAETKLPSPQAQADLFAKGGGKIGEARDWVMEKGAKAGGSLLNGVDEAGIVKRAWGVGNELLDQLNQSVEPGSELRGPAKTPDIGKFYRPASTNLIDRAEAPSLIAPQVSSTNTPISQAQSTANVGQGAKSGEMVVTFRGEGEFMQALAKAASVSYNKVLHGNS